MTATLRFRKRRSSGVVCVRIKTPRGNQWISTGQTSYAKAREVCTAAEIERKQLAASAGVLSAEVIQRLLIGRCVNCTAILDAWKAEMVAQLSPDTLSNYEALLRQFLVDTANAAAPITGIRRTTIHAWVNAPRIPVGSRRARLAAVRSYFGFASAAGHCVGNVSLLVTVQIRDLLLPELERRETLPLTPADYAMLMASPKVRGFWRFAIPIAYWLSLALRDVACLEWASIRPSTFIYYRKKTGARIALPLDDPLLGAGELQRVFLAMIEQLPSAGHSPYCFPEERACTLHPKKRAKLSVQFTRLLRAHGIKGRGKRFHSCRHAAAMRLKAAGKTLEEIGTVLGHASTETTMIYTSH
jgi:site-specific recombinase XerD